MGEQWSQFSQCLEEGTPGSGKQNQRRESGPARTPQAGSFMLPPRAAGPPAPPTDREPLPRHAAAVARARRPRGPSGAHPRVAQRPTGRVSPGSGRGCGPVRGLGLRGPAWPLPRPSCYGA